MGYSGKRPDNLTRGEGGGIKTLTRASPILLTVKSHAMWNHDYIYSDKSRDTVEEGGRESTKQPQHRKLFASRFGFCFAQIPEVTLGVL